MIEVFAEYGVIGVMVMLFAGQMMFLQKTLMSKLMEIEQITIKLIDRWNKSDEKAERRHEKQIGQMNYLTDDVNFLKGRINGGTRG
jgi:ribosomal protein S3